VKIYTRTGDAGQTSLRWGHRVSKDALRVEAYGTVDETCAFVGVALSALPPGQAAGPLGAMLRRVQNELFSVGADLAVEPDRDKGQEPKVKPALVTGLEADIDALEAGLDPLRSFILPGGSPAASALHAARTVCRRAERDVVRLGAVEAIDPVLLKYVNRLSDFLFVAARAANQAEGVADIKVDWT